MAAQRGRDVLLKLSDGGAPETFVTVAGVRAASLALQARAVDATSAESPQAWRELLAGAGVKSATLVGAGVFKDAASDALIRAAFFDQSPRRWRLVAPDFGTFEGPFLVEALEYGGAQDTEATFAIRLASAGLVAFAP